MTPPPFLVLEYIERYPRSLDVGRFRRVHADGNALQVLDSFGESVVTRLSLDGLCARIIAAVAVLLAVVALARRPICCSYATEKKEI